MWILFSGGAIALLCVAASARRLVFAMAPTYLRVPLLLDALGSGLSIEVLASAIADEPGADWERAVLDAMGQPAALRTALLNEQLGELEYRVQRWARVPRVCASIATSSGFFLATIALTVALGDRGALAADALASRAFGSVALGIAGGAFCIAAQIRSQRAVKELLVATDKRMGSFSPP